MSRFVKNLSLFVGLLCLCCGGEYSRAAVQSHSILPGASAGVALSANGDFHRFRVDLKAATPAETKVVNNTTYTKATDGRFYAPTISWSLTQGYTAHPGWGQTGTAGKVESGDLFDGFEISTGNPDVILLKLGYHLTVKGKRLKAGGPGGNGTGPSDEEEEWGASFSGVAIENFNPSQQFEIGGTKSYVLEDATSIIGTTTAGQTVNADTGNASDAPYTYKLTLESGPHITQPVTLFQSGTQSAARQHSTLYTWNVNEMQGDARRWPKGKYLLKLSVAPTGNSGAPGEDAVWVYVGKPEVEWSGTMVLNRPNDEGTYEYFDTTIGAEQVLRLCAGAIPNDDVHSSDVTATLKLGESILASEELVFSFDGNGTDYTGVTPPKLIDGTTVADTLTKATNAQGQIGFTTRSSDLISMPSLVAKWHGLEVGRLKCDFDAVLSYRRFPNPYDPDETTDTGWLFDFPHFEVPNRITPAKVYLKFMKNPIIGDIDGNWSFVNDHWLRIKVVGVVLHESHSYVSGTPEELQHYAYVVNSSPDNTEPYTDVVKTGEHPNDQGVHDGAAQSQVQAGSDIGDVDAVYIGADELTQVAD